MHASAMYTNSLHDFSEYGLPVSRAFSGDDKRDSLQLFIEFYQIEYGFDTGFQLPVQEDHQGCPQTAGCTCAGNSIHIDSELTAKNISVILHTYLQFIKDFGSAAFLFPKRIRGAVLAAERIGDVAHYSERRIFYKRIQAGCVYPAHTGQISAAADQFMTVCIKEFYAKGAHASHTTVVCGRTAYGNGNISESSG